MSSTPNYTELTRVYTRLYRYYHLSSIVGWDRNAMMPPRGNDARAAAEAGLSADIRVTGKAEDVAAADPAQSLVGPEPVEVGRRDGCGGDGEVALERRRTVDASPEVPGVKASQRN